MRCPVLKNYALWDVQGYKSTMALSWKWSITFYAWRKPWANFITCYLNYLLKTCVKRYIATAKRNLKVVQKNVHRLNLIKSKYTFHPTYSKNIGQM